MIDFNIGKFLKGYRLSKELSTRELAKKIGFSYSYIAAVEKGSKNNPSKEFIENYIYGISDNIHEISYIKELISKKTNGEYYPDFLEIKKNTVKQVNENESLISAILEESSPNFMFYEEEGLILEKRFTMPINDLGYHLTDKYNSKYFRKLKMTDEDRNYIFNMINEYFIRKVQIQKAEIEHNKQQNNLSNEVSEQYINDYANLIEKLQDSNSLKY
ncbi:helix-turn-helix domain-containing protein [Staphylococcus ureilyticus]|uniref:helix-turn-helix domain-containing protein n=1 Tax=Staphylococcus ureilyticus TaxID=94138 RepID=UPI00387A93B2